MKKRILFFIQFVLFFGTAVMAQKDSSNLNVYVLDAKVLAANKSKIKSGDPLLQPAYKKLINDANKDLLFQPVSVMEKEIIPPSGNKHDYMSLAPYHWPDPSKSDGLPYLRKDGQTNPEVKKYKDKQYLPLLCDKIFKLSLAYYFSNDNKYAQHAAQLIQVWFLDTATRMNPNLNFAQAIKGVNTGRGAGLIDARHFIKVIEAAGLLHENNYWTATDDKELKTWFTDFLQWMQTSENGIHEMHAKNNHGVWYDALRLSIALYTDKTELAKKVVSNAEARLDKQMNEEGKFPLEMARTTSLHYTVFVMDAFFNIAKMAEKTGIDFWEYQSHSGKSLQKGFEELVPYISKKKEWQGQQIKPFDFEEGFQLLANGYIQLGCSDCKKSIKDIAGDRAPGLLNNLLY